jgi:serine/threonine-protein kinase
MPTVLRPDLPPAIDDVFARVLAKNPGDRYESCKDFMTAAREALGRLADLPSPSGSPRSPRTGFGPVSPPAESAAVAYQADLYPPQARANPPAELTHDSADAFRAPTASWSSFPSVPPLPPAGQPVPPGPPGGKRRSQHRARGRGWLVAAAALVLAVGGAAAVVTLALTGGHHTQAAGNAKTGTAGAGLSSVSPNASATRTGTAGAASSVAVPTVAGKIQVGHTPSYIQVAPNGKFAYITNPGAGAITVLNTANDVVSGSIGIPQGPPQSVSFSPDSRTAYVSVYNTKNSVHLIAFIDTATSTVTSTVSVDNFTPGPSTTSPDGRYLYVPNHNMAMSGPNENVIDVIDTAAKKLTGKIAVPPNPHWIAFGKNGRFYATDHMSTTVTVVNARTNGIIKEIEVGETPHSIAISPDGSRLAVTSFNGNEVFLVNTATDQEVARIPVGRNPLEVTYSPDGRSIYTVNNEDNTVTVIDTADNRVIAKIPTGKAPTSISVLPDGRRAYVSDENDGTIEVLNIAQ